MRAFIAIDIPEDIKKEIIKLQDRLPEFTGKKTEPENLHLTLKFLDWIDGGKLEEIKNQLKKIKFDKFRVEIDAIGLFDYRIIWVNMKNCEELQKEIDKALSGLFEQEEKFMGHLTIARMKRVEDKLKFNSELSKIKFKSMNFFAADFKLKESRLKKSRPIYRDLEAYGLTG
jgi:2'-5' RNA ligase